MFLYYMLQTGTTATGDSVSRGDHSQYPEFLYLELEPQAGSGPLRGFPRTAVRAEREEWVTNGKGL